MTNSRVYGGQPYIPDQPCSHCPDDRLDCTYRLCGTLVRVTIFTINFTRLSVSDGSGRLIWAPYLRLAGRGLGVVDARYGVKCAWPAVRDRCAESRPELETVNK